MGSPRSRGFASGEGFLALLYHSPRQKDRREGKGRGVDASFCNKPTTSLITILISPASQHCYMGDEVSCTRASEETTATGMCCTMKRDCLPMSLVPRYQALCSWHFPNGKHALAIQGGPSGPHLSLC